MLPLGVFVYKVTALTGHHQVEAADEFEVLHCFSNPSRPLLWVHLVPVGPQQLREHRAHREPIKTLGFSS